MKTTDLFLSFHATLHYVLRTFLTDSEAIKLIRVNRGIHAVYRQQPYIMKNLVNIVVRRGEFTLNKPHHVVHVNKIQLEIDNPDTYPFVFPPTTPIIEMLLVNDEPRPWMFPPKLVILNVPNWVRKTRNFNTIPLSVTYLKISESLKLWRLSIPSHVEHVDIDYPVVKLPVKWYAHSLSCWVTTPLKLGELITNLRLKFPNMEMIKINSCTNPSNMFTIDKKMTLGQILRHPTLHLLCPLLAHGKITLRVVC